MKNNGDISIVWKVGEKEKIQKRAEARGMSFNMHMKDVALRAIEKEKNASKRKK